MFKIAKWHLSLVVFCTIFFGCQSKNKFWEQSIFEGQKKADYSVVFFISGDCPLCNVYKSMIVGLKDSLNNHWAVYTIRTDLREYKEFKPGDFGLECGDPDGSLKKLLGSTVTPEVFILNAKSEILYQGAIDNYAWETGKHRLRTTEFYLLDAIKCIKENKSIKVPFVKPIGCYIE